MADNYLEKRYSEVFGSGARKVTRINQSLDSLLVKNRSTRGYNREHPVRMQDLRKIVEVCTRVASARNQQILRFRLVSASDPDTAAVEEKMRSYIHLGAALPQEHLPKEGLEPLAYIICCAPVEDRFVDMDLGIAVQSMLLKATEMGLNGCFICAFDAKRVAEDAGIPQDLKPLALVAIGKSAEKIQLLQIAEAESHSYYRRDGIHYVPKVKLEDILI